MAGVPAAQHRIVFQIPMFHGPMLLLANVTERDPLLGFLANPEACRIPGPIWRAPGTMARVAEIAAIPKLFIAGDFTEMFRRGAMPFPTGTQWKASRMDPESGIVLLYRQEKRTSQWQTSNR